MNMKLPMLEADDREKAISPRETVAALNLEPGSTVLDIGAGTGILTFEIARVLDGKGKVYATDVAKNMIDLLKTRVRDWGIANVEPVLVSGEGVDPFYRQHKFDVIIAFEMFVYLADPAAYFRELRGSLKSEKGRLFIGNGKHFPRFDRSDFADLPAVAGQLRELAPTHPLIKRLDPKLVAALTAGDQPDGASAGLAEMLAKAFNAVLDDNLFFGEMDAYYNARTQVASEVLQIVPARLGVLTRWLVYAFDQTALFEEPSRVLNDQEKYVVFTLNKILLEGLFRQSMATTNFAFPKALYLPPAGVARRLEKAGFRLVRVHDSLPYFDLMEFAPN
jgi:SAM-dependent methyltransferase